MNRYAAKTGLPAARTGRIEALRAPLGFDPGERWEYGINIDIAGRMVEVAGGQNLEAYFRDHLFRRSAWRTPDSFFRTNGRDASPPSTPATKRAR